MNATDKPRRRRLSEDEHALWHGVTRSVAPLKRRPHLHFAEVLEVGTADRKAKHAASKRARSVPSQATAVSHAPPVAKPAWTGRSPPPPVVFDRRMKQRLARGSEEIAARIDLHGRTQVEAHAALLRFLQRAQADGAKTVLVITGKGFGQNGFAGERGVLKKQVPHWLALPEFRAYVAGVEDAHVVHGGQGALYVRVRRARAGS